MRVRHPSVADATRPGRVAVATAVARHSPTGGFRVGILTLATSHRLVPGNVQHAASFPFPVVYEVVPKITFQQLLTAQPAAEAPIVAAIRRLEDKGVRVIVGACGSFANWQEAAVAAARVPIYLSIMTQVPFVLAGLPRSQRLGVVFASPKAYTPHMLAQCGIGEPERLVVVGADDIAEFRAVLAGTAELDDAAISRGCVTLLRRVQKRERNIGAWLLQCSDLPPYAAAIQQATGLAVFDMSVLIEHLFRVNCRKPYAQD